MTAPDLGAITLADGSTAADLGSAVTAVSANWSVGTVAELRVDIADKGRVLQGHSLLALGTELAWNGGGWQVGAVDRTYAGWGIAASVACRSSLAKALRLSADKTRTDKNVTPQSWIQRRVAELGGVAVVQPGSSKRSIVQKRGQSVLDVITALASTMETDWVEVDGTIYVGTPWWAFEGGTGLPMWPVSWLSAAETDATALSGTVSADDATNGASASLTLPYSQAEGIRPWHRIQLSGAGDPLDGIWLVGDVTLDVGTQSPVSLSLTRPLQSAPKKGSAAKKSGGSSSGSTSGSSGSSSGSASGARRSPSKPVSRTPARTTTPNRSTTTNRSPSKPVSREPNTYAPGTRRPYAYTTGITAGYRYSRGGFHGATDYGMPVGTDLLACRSGVVLACNDGVRNNRRGYNPGSNSPSNWILLGIKYQGQPATVYYQHLSPGLLVRKGQRVGVGKHIGNSGNSGNSSGPHLHIEARWGHGPRYSGARIYPPSKVWA